MPEYTHVAHATFSPTSCRFCAETQGPFIDTCVEDVFGRIYVCASTEARSGCVRQMAVCDGMVARAEVEETLVAYQAIIDELQEALSQAQNDKVVALPDVLTLLEVSRG